MESAKSFTLEFDYTGSGDDPYISGTVVGGTYYFLSVVEWDTIIKNAPIDEDNGYKKIYWRVRINDTVSLEDGPCYSDWSYFRIIID